MNCRSISDSFSPAAAYTVGLLSVSFKTLIKGKNTYCHSNLSGKFYNFMTNLTRLDGLEMFRLMVLFLRLVPLLRKDVLYYFSGFMIALLLIVPRSYFFCNPCSIQFLRFYFGFVRQNDNWRFDKKLIIMDLR